MDDVPIFGRRESTVSNECEICGGCGEVNALTQRYDRDQIGYPACIVKEKNEAIARLQAENKQLRALLLAARKAEPPA